MATKIQLSTTDESQAPPVETIEQREPAAADAATTGPPPETPQKKPINWRVGQPFSVPTIWVAYPCAFVLCQVPRLHLHCVPRHPLQFAGNPSLDDRRAMDRGVEFANQSRAEEHQQAIFDSNHLHRFS